MKLRVPVQYLTGYELQKNINVEMIINQIGSRQQKLGRSVSRDGSFFVHGPTAPSGPVPPHYRDFTITLRHTTLRRTLWTSDELDAETST